MSENFSHAVGAAPHSQLMIRGQGGLRIDQATESVRWTLESRLARCDLELASVLKLDVPTEVFEIDVSNLRSVFLDENPVFSDLVEQIRIWNRDVIALKQGDKPIAKPNYRYYRMQALHRILRDVVNTRDRYVQNYYLTSLREWYYNNKNGSSQSNEMKNALNLSSDRSSNNHSSLLAKRKGMGHSSRAFTSILNTNSLNEYQDKNQVDLSDYVSQRRSLHSTFEPPSDRIKEFTKKELRFRQEFGSSSSLNDSVRQTALGLSQSRPITQGSVATTAINSVMNASMRGGVADTVSGPGVLSMFEMSMRSASRGGITTSQSQFRDFATTANLTAASSISNFARDPKYEAVSSNISGINASPWTQSKSKMFFEGQVGNSNAISHSNSMLVQSQQVFSDEKNSVIAGMTPQKPFNRSMLNVTGVAAGGSNRKTYTSDDNAKYNSANDSSKYSHAAGGKTASSYKPRSTFLKYVPSNNISEVRLENTWYVNRNRAVREKREQEELKKHIQTWSVNKGIFDQEINLKNTLTAHGSNFQEIGIKKSSGGGVVELNENNFMEKQPSAEEVEFKGLHGNYLELMRQPREEKASIGIKQETNSELGDPIIEELAEEQQFAGDEDQIANNRNSTHEKVPEKANYKVPQKENATKSNVTQGEIEIAIAADVLKQHEERRPKTTYVNFKEQVRASSVPVVNPFLDLEQKMKREKFLKLKESKGKIIGLLNTRNLLTVPAVVKTSGKVDRSNAFGVAAVAAPGQMSASAVIASADALDEEDKQLRQGLSLQLQHRKNLSVGSVRNMKSSDGFRPFSQIYSKRASMHCLKSQEITEIESVRKAFAKKGVQCSMKTISQSLSIFPGLPQDQVKQLPAPGSMLFVNPFDNFSKTKKSSKKSK